MTIAAEHQDPCMIAVPNVCSIAEGRKQLLRTDVERLYAELRAPFNERRISTLPSAAHAASMARLCSISVEPDVPMTDYIAVKLAGKRPVTHC